MTKTIGKVENYRSKIQFVESAKSKQNVRCFRLTKCRSIKISYFVSIIFYVNKCHVIIVKKTYIESRLTSHYFRTKIK